MAAASDERARGRCALSRFCLTIGFSSFLILCGPASAEPDCAADRIDAAVRVDYVHDGDTVFLRNGQRLRLIGVDTPELGRDGGPDQPFAVTARDTLRQRLPAGASIRLRHDTELQDVHGRRLAHAFFDNGGSIAAWLLDQGLATLLILPPDLWNADCYAAAERRARMARRGLWSRAEYQPVSAADLPPAARGYRVVRARVLRVRQAPRTLWLNLEARFAVRIDLSDLDYFSAVPLHALTGREVTVRGLVYPVGGELHLKLRHPANLEWRE